MPVYHEHNSPKEIQSIQMVDGDHMNRSIMCTTCMDVHPVVSDPVLNICVGTGQLHNIHTPRTSWSSESRMPPDPIHIDWVTVCGATIMELERAWLLDYRYERRPMRILICAGIEDIARGRSRDEIVEDLMHFKIAVDNQNVHHPDKRNEMVIATVLNPPKYTWFTDNGHPPRNHHNHLDDIRELNSWITYFNGQNGKNITPRFHRFGVKDCASRDADGRRVRIKKHIFSHWNPDHFLLKDKLRVKLGTAVVRHFLGEQARSGMLG